MWSPSSTETWLACPLKWWLARQGVEGRATDTSAQEQGTQFHEVIAGYWATGQHVDIANPAVNRAVFRVIAQEGEALREQGIVGIEVNLDGNDEEAARHGRYPGTCDLITDNGVGLTVTDYKTKMKMDAKYADGEIRQTQRSWQLKQYAYFAQLKYGRPVTQVRKLLVAFTPALKVWLATYVVTQQELSMWHHQAENVWREMDQMIDGLSPTWQNTETCERYGWQWRCQYYSKCWEGDNA